MVLHDQIVIHLICRSGSSIKSALSKRFISGLIFSARKLQFFPFLYSSFPFIFSLLHVVILLLLALHAAFNTFLYPSAAIQCASLYSEQASSMELRTFMWQNHAATVAGRRAIDSSLNSH
jgi:hypothetical protein